MIRLLLDGFWWVDGPPSGRNVLRSLVFQWSRQFPADELTLRVQRNHVPQVEEDLRRSRLGVRVEHFPGWTRYHAAAVGTIVAHRHQYDAVLSQNFCPPLSTAACVVLVHDALFVTNPEWFTRKELLYLRMMRPSLKRATTVLATSHSEAVRIGTVWPELRERLVEVGLGVPAGLAEARPKRPTSWTDSAPFILTVGRLNVRKNLARLVDAFALVANRDPTRHLVVVGEKDGAYVPRTIPSHIAVRVHFLRYVADDELRWLYEHCDLFVFPSLDEGYGLPLVEANMMGAPVIASDIPVFRELNVATDYFDPGSVDDIASAIERGLQAPTVLQAAVPTWADVVGNIRRAIEKEAQ